MAGANAGMWPTCARPPALAARLPVVQIRHRDRCTLWMNQAEAARLALADGQQVVIRSTAGTLEAPLQVTDEIREGVVSLPPATVTAERAPG